MAGYNSKFTGQQVDSLLEKAGSSYQKPETGIPQSDLDESTQQILQNVENKVNKEEGKGLSTNDFTDEYKAKVDDSASQEGYFPKMSVGIAANLAGRGEATEQVFTYRPTDGGTSIESGVAKIRRVKGNSVVWNQILVPRNLTETSNGITVTQDGTGKVVVKGTATATTGVAVGTAQIITGHKYVYFGLIGGGANKFYWSDQTTSVDTGKGCIAQPTYATGNRYFVLMVLQGITVDFTFYPQVCDLTQMFCAGNESDTVEEFRELYPDSYYPYNAGKLRNLNCYGIKTVGFNEFNGTYARVLPNKTYYLGGEYTSIAFATELGGTTEAISLPSDRLYIPTQLGYIYASGVNININLHHTGWRDGDYEPYKEVTHSLPLSEITNGEPLRKAGSVYDEINETHYIKRVGVRPYSEGDKNDATLLTDGTNTNYPLAEPIVTPIETVLNLDYQAEDFGTEEALLTDNSAPFSADIVYQFNAVDRIRENTLDIEDLLARVIALENAAAATTSIPDIPDITE